jgi:hypothetical protein
MRGDEALDHGLLSDSCEVSGPRDASAGWSPGKKGRPERHYFPTLTGAPTEREEMPHPLDTLPHQPPFAGSLHKAGTNAA